MLAEALELRHEGYRKKRHGESERGHKGVLCEMKSELDFVQLYGFAPWSDLNDKGGVIIRGIVRITRPGSGSVVRALNT
jgi:hypothetical protein